MPRCNLCNRSFNGEDALLMHNKSKLHFKCTFPGCSRKYKTLLGRDKHESSHHRFNCSSCSQKFGSKEALEQHEGAKHPSPRHKCRYCDRRFATDEGRLSHQKAKHESRTAASSSYISSPSLYVHAPVVKPALVEKPSVNAVIDSSSSAPESSDGEDVSMTQSPKAQAATPKPAANFACGTCGEHVATILALEAHELQHKPDPCACTICERADKPCSCVICKRTNTSTSALVDEKVLDCVVSDEPEETVLLADSVGDVGLDVVEDSLVGSCDLVMTLESQGATDLSIDHSVPAHGMDSQDEQPLLELEREVDGERSHDLTPTYTPSTPRHSLDDPTCLSEVVINLTEGCSITNLQVDIAPMECDSIPCDLNVLEQVRSVILILDKC
ncbi:hypothetical protein CY34DRAFT_194361 [Suillus luteus UH-Slu-Lm8-n1]|uniref:C2H2-type domain-containing protein n=1 Tax=Suillus luteus UH-Slu-Lm8-n1 TaxID=930992 RepID=A0A0D0AIG7_9AGAM|nr:hypothetical protein CY34DRAFT_194361 [Suillus luteus UH-Slu-Lm8-n1]